MQVLLVEDDEFKRKNISDFVKQQIWCHSLRVAVSVSGAIVELDDVIFDLVLLDMAIPNHDEGADGAQGLGGLAVFRYLETIAKRTKVIVVTQFEALSEGSTVVDIHTLENLLTVEFGEQFCGLVRYLTDTNDWQSEISRLATSK
jgi:CheY-like chemotaxis protein